MTKRFSHGIELLSSWTYSHTIDDSTDLSTLLFQSPYHQSDSGFWKKFLANFVSPVVEVASGRPYNVLIGSDPNLDFGTATNRQSFIKTNSRPPGSVTSPFIKGFAFVDPNRCIGSDGTPFSSPDVPSPFYGCTGTLGRNAFTRPGFFQIDLRISRTIPITERFNLQIIADGSNMLNRFNASDVNPLCDPISGTCTAGQPTAAFDPRTFQFALKINF